MTADAEEKLKEGHERRDPGIGLAPRHGRLIIGWREGINKDAPPSRSDGSPSFPTAPTGGVWLYYNLSNLVCQYLFARFYNFVNTAQSRFANFVQKGVKYV